MPDHTRLEVRDGWLRHRLIVAHGHVQMRSYRRFALIGPWIEIRSLRTVFSVFEEASDFWQPMDVASDGYLRRTGAIPLPGFE